MAEFVSHFIEFLWDVLINWRNLIAAVVFAFFSFPNAALSPEARVDFDARWPPDFRRKWLVRIAMVYAFFACFQAWNTEHTGRLNAEAALSKQARRDDIRKGLQLFYVRDANLEEDVVKLVFNGGTPISAESLAQLDQKFGEFEKDLEEWAQKNMGEAATRKLFSVPPNQVRATLPTPRLSMIMTLLGDTKINIDDLLKTSAWDNTP